MSLPDNLMLASYNLPCWHSIFPSKFWHYPLEPFCHQAASPKKTLQSRVPAPLGEALSDAPPEDRSGDRGGSAGEDRTGSVKEDWGWENLAWVACCFIFCLTVGVVECPAREKSFASFFRISKGLQNSSKFATVCELELVSWWNSMP